MIPDAAVFFPRLFDYNRAHSVGGLFIVCLPLGLGAFLAWEFLLKRPLADLAPDSLRRRLGEAAPVRFSCVALFVAAALVVAGAGTHVFWDSFTHVGRWGVRHVPVLGEVWFTLPDWVPTGDPQVRGYRLGQYGSTLALLPVVAAYAIVRLRRRPPAGPGASPVPPRIRAAVFAALLCGPAAAAGRSFFRSLPYYPLRLTAVRAVVAAGVWLAVGTVAYSLAHLACVGDGVEPEPD